MKTHIMNNTSQPFDLKEGNAGAYRFLRLLDPGVKFSIKVDPNATYREYMVATGKKGETIFLTSDDFNEYKVIEIVEVPGKEPGTVIYKSVPRDPRNPRAPKPSNVGGAGCESKAEEGSNAEVGSDPPAPSAAGAGSVPPAPSAAGAGSVPPAPSAAGDGSDPPASSAAAVGSVPAVSSAAGVGSVPPASTTARAGSDPSALSVASSKGISNQNERVPWYRKLKQRFKST